MQQALDTFHTFTWAHALIIFLCAWMILVLVDKAPHVSSVKYLLSSLNDKGGHILVLVILTIMFFRAAMELLYYALGHIVDGKIDAQNALLVQGFQFVTGTAFGAAIGALLTSMNASNVRAGSTERGDTSSTVISKVTRTNTPSPSSADTVAAVSAAVAAAAPDAVTPVVVVAPTVVPAPLDAPIGG